MVAGFPIGVLSRTTGTQVETIRYYERVGLLPAPARTAGNYRSYGKAHLERLSFIRRARDLGFSLAQVRNLLGFADQKNRSCDLVDLIAREHLAEMDRKITDLTALRHALGILLDQCRRGKISECRIIEALAPNM